MCTGAAAAAGVSLPASAAVEPKSKIAREEWDVVVVGAGFAGLCAALEAKEKGAKVLLIEKMGRPDCTSAYSSGWIAATKTRYQDKDDDDSKELYFKEMMEVSGGRSDPALIRAYAEIAGESVDWLGDHGMTYKIWKQHAPERMRCHIVPAVNGLTGGAHMVKVMLEALEKAGVPVRYNTKAVELVTDECFNVLGVSCIEKHRRVELMTKGGVILATGGFAGNNAMVGQYIGPWASRMVVRGAPWATGEASRSRPPPQSSPSRRSPARSGTSSWWARASRASAPRSKPRKRAPRFFSSRRWAVPTARPPTAPAGSPRRKRAIRTRTTTIPRNSTSRR